MKKINKIFFLLLIIPIMTCGCWDKVEINERAFVSAIGIDVFEAEHEEKENVKGKIDEPYESPKNKYSVTYVFPNLNAIGKNTASDKLRFVMGSVGMNFFETTRELTTRLNRTLFFRHMKAVLIGEDVARNGDYLREILDSLERHEEISRKLIIAVAEGRAKDVIEVEPVIEPVTGTFLSNVIGQNPSIARFNVENLNDILVSIHGTGRTLIPRVVPGKEEIKVAGSAVIKDYKLIGWLGELENRAVMFLRDQVKAEIVNVVNEGIIVPFVITDSSTRKNVKIENDNIKVDFSIEMEGYIQQFKIDVETPVLDNKVIKDIEDKVENKLEREINGTIEKLQKEFKVDVIGVDEHLSKFKPDLWENIKNDWDNIFPNIRITASVDAKLRRIGMTR